MIKLLKRVLPYIGILFSICALFYYPGSEMIDAWKRQQIAQQLDIQSSGMDTERKEMLLSQARSWNQLLAGETPDISSDNILPYDEQLNYYGSSDSFGYLLIPKINLTLPIYHGLSEEVLQVGSGHSDTSSLPIGGDSTHSVLSGHSGMVNMRAFDDIRELENGDIFGIKILGDFYCYKVYSIETVDPEDMSSLSIQNGKDLCTLVTCTPYGINNKRLLIHAERCDVPEGFGDSVPGAVESLESPRAIPITIVIIISAIFLIIRMRERRHRRDMT